MNYPHAEDVWVSHILVCMVSEAAPLTGFIESSA